MRMLSPTRHRKMRFKLRTRIIRPGPGALRGLFLDGLFLDTHEPWSAQT